MSIKFYKVAESVLDEIEKTKHSDAIIKIIRHQEDMFDNFYDFVSNYSLLEGLITKLLYEKQNELKEYLEKSEEKYDRLRIEYEELNNDYESLKKSIKADSEIDSEVIKDFDDEADKEFLEALNEAIVEDSNDTTKRKRKRDSFGRYKNEH